MKQYLVIALLLMTGCACSKKQEKRDAAVRRALADTRVRYDYAVDQNERYSKQVRKLAQENRRLKGKK